MLGERLREARLAAGLSLDALARGLQAPISKQALSKYERGLSQPTPARLADIAAALDVRPSRLLSEARVDIRWVAYRKLARLSKARRDRITALAARRLETELRFRGLFHLGERHDLPGPIPVNDISGCEHAAVTLRMAWNLGDRPISNMIELIEERGVIVLSLCEATGFDALSGWAGATPTLILNDEVPPDRIRFSAAHELGHLVMASCGDEKRDEAYAHRFAASLLAPADAARRELGPRRLNISLDELTLLKQRWGLSMQAWIRRAHDLEIISPQLYRGLNARFLQKGWHRVEPAPYSALETPTLSHRLALRALSEGIITPDEMEHLLPGPGASPGSEPRGPVRAPSALRELARLPLDERRRVLSGANVEVDEAETDWWEALDADDVD